MNSFPSVIAFICLEVFPATANTHLYSLCFCRILYDVNKIPNILLQAKTIQMCICGGSENFKTDESNNGRETIHH